MNDDFAQPRTGSFRAVVRAGPDETAYQRAGAGQPLVLVSERAIDDPFWQELTDHLATRFRVVVPAVAAGRTDFSSWLRLFLDGIGYPEVALVAGETLSAPAVGFAVLEPDRVRALVVLSGTDDDTVTDVGGTRLFTVRADRSADELARVIGELLSAPGF